MLTLLFIICMLSFAGEVIGLAFKATWGLTKLVFYIVFFPVILLGMIIAGLIELAIPLLIVVGIFMLMKYLAEES